MGDALPAPGSRRLGDFEIVRELGRGGMGIVYEARQVSLNRRVALKVLAAGLGLTGKAVQRFRREAEAAARLHHTNIVPVYATGDEHGTYFYAMELINGPSLDHVLRQLRHPPAASPTPAASPEPLAPALGATGPYLEPSPLSPSPAGSSSLSSPGSYFDTVARMIAEVADALDYAHRQGVIHRDVKPSNLLLSPEGRLSVNDFGLARMLEQPGMTLTGEFVGTPAYMSPEQITAGRTPLDHRTDIYSLGATLYELLTLHPPFRGERRDQVLAQIIHKEPRPPRKVNRRVPVDLETICLKALDKDPDRRYQTAGKMAEDLRRFVNRFAIAARRAGPVERLRKWVRRHPGLAAGLACTLVALSVAGFFAYRAHVAEEQRKAEQQRHEELLREERRETAVERAMLAAMGGDMEGAEKFIQVAEAEGAPAGRVWFLRGLVAYYRDDNKDALQKLEQAVRLLGESESAAARGLLAAVYNDEMRGEDSDREKRALASITPITFEDYLFKGYATSWDDPEEGLKLMDRAVSQRPSAAVARLYCAEARCYFAQERGDAQIADLAIQDVMLATALLPNNDYLALCERSFVHQMTAGVYQATGFQAKYQAALDQAKKDVEALRAFPETELAAFQRLSFFQYYGDMDRALEESRRTTEKCKTPQVDAIRAWIHYLRGSRSDLQEALRIAESHRNFCIHEVLRCCLLAELEGAEAALKAHQELGARDLGSQQLYTYTVYFLLGRKDLARDASKHDRQRGLHFPQHQHAFFQKALDYVAGDLPIASLVEATAHSRWNESLAYYLVGLTLLAEGDRGTARDYFQKAIENRITYSMSYDLSKVFLARLDKDPTWPPWIPVKK